MTLSRIGFILFLTGAGFFLMTQRGVFLPEVVMASSCERSTLESPKTRVHLIELYTSEGCSSCPPAEKWINSLRGNKELGSRFFPISFHVDYWDYIGWRDPLAKEEYSKRQRRYASNWKSRSVYTPGFVKNGAEWKGLAVRSLPTKSEEAVGILKASPLSKNKYQVSFTGESKNLRINYARLGNGIVSNVTKGENRGKKLKQFFAVLELRSEKFINNMEIEIPISKIKAKESMLAVWLDHPASMKPVQVVGGCL